MLTTYTPFSFTMYWRRLVRLPLCTISPGIFICIIVFLSHTSLNAQETLKIEIREKETGKVIAGAIMLVEGKPVIQSDSQGRIIIPQSSIRNATHFVIYKNGYKPDTVKASHIPPQVYLSLLSSEMAEIVFTDKKTERVLRSTTEYVLDYDFTGPDILIATHSGYNSKRGKLFLANKYGDILARGEINISAERLFRSCTGKFYLVTYKAFYPVEIDTSKNTLTLASPISLNQLGLLDECVLFKSGKYYYKFSSPNYFMVAFASAGENDETLKLIKKFENHNDMHGSADDLTWALAEPDVKTKAAKFRSRLILDKVAFKEIDVGLFAVSDTLIIFDFKEKQINFYDQDRALIRQQPILFHSGGILRSKVLQDIVTEQFYVLNEQNLRNELRCIDIHTGATIGKTIVLERPFAENIKIRDGEIYYLWQNKNNAATRQLFVERNRIVKPQQ